MNRSTRAARDIGAVVVAGLVLVGCGLATPTEQRTPTATADVPLVWPLTGVPAQEVAERPAVSVKIENSRAARPQRGLLEADIVWEEVVEGGITRFVATYHSTVPDAVEPVRSVRPMDPAIVAPLDGILAFSGGQAPFILAVERYGTQTVIMDEGDPGFVRDPDRPAPHNVVGDVSSFLDQADDQRTSPPPAQFRYAGEAGEGTAPRTGQPADTVDVRLSPAQRSVWTWDGEAGQYLRSEGSEPSVSADGRRHAARNVVVLSTEVFGSNQVDSTGDPVPEHRLAGSGGEGTLFSMGHGVAVRWSKEDHNAPIVLRTEAGEEARLDPGTTWIELVPRGSGSWTPR